jgi:fatty acid/phospholipid biosynthesis enzyme
LEALRALAKPVSARPSHDPAASEVVEMHEPPADALRKKKDSSMRGDQPREGRGRAGVRIGGQHRRLMAISRFS